MQCCSKYISDILCIWYFTTCLILAVSFERFLYWQTWGNIDLLSFLLFFVLRWGWRHPTTYPESFTVALGINSPVILHWDDCKGMGKYTMKEQLLKFLIWSTCLLRLHYSNKPILDQLKHVLPNHHKRSKKISIIWWHSCKSLFKLYLVGSNSQVIEILHRHTSYQGTVYCNNFYFRSINSRSNIL